MNKKITVALASTILLVLPLVSMAIVFTGQPGESNINIIYVIQGILTTTWWAFMGLVVILFIIAGISFLTAEGDPTKLEQARQFVLWGTVGVIVGVLAFSAIIIVRNTFVI